MRVLTPCSLWSGQYPCCLYHQGLKWRHCVSLKSWYPSPKVCGVTTQKTICLTHFSLLHPGQFFFVFQSDGPTIRYCISLSTASLGLTSTTKGGARGSFIGYSAAGLPLYNFTNSTLHQTSRSVLLQASSFFKQILADHNSRRIFYFLCLNLSKFNCPMLPACHSPLFTIQKRYRIK